MNPSRILVLAIVLAASPVIHAQPAQYRARLAIVPIDLAMQATIAGSGMVTATLKGATMTINGTFTGLKTAATVARVHRGPRTAMRGAPIGDLVIAGNTSGTISGSLDLTREQIDDLAAGRIYVQLHSEKAPDGNLWGWLLAAEKK